MTRDAIRDRIFGAKASHTTVMLGDIPVTVRSPTFGDRSRILDRATTLVSGEPKIDMGKLQAYALVMLTYDSVGTRVFDEKDIEPLYSQTNVSNDLDDLINACVKAMNVRKEDVEAVGNV